MKALGLHQPWAGLIRFGHKTIETRFWSTAYRGPVLICSTRGVDQEGVKRFKGSCTEHYMPDEVFRDLGTMQCTADLVDCHIGLDEDEGAACCSLEELNPSTNKRERKHAFVLINIRPVVRKPVKCSRRWFDVPDEVIEHIDPSTFPKRDPFESLPMDELAFVKSPSKEEIERVMVEAARDTTRMYHPVLIDRGLRFR